MSTPAAGPGGPLQVRGEVIAVKRAGALWHLTLRAPGVAERFRPGTFLSLSVGGELSSRLLRRSFPIHRVRATGPYGDTVETVFEAVDHETTWLSRATPGTPVDVVAPLGRPFALPKEPVTCVLVGVGAAVAPLFSLAERLRARACPVHMVLGAPGESRLFGALEARRTTRGVTVATADGSVGLRGEVVDPLPDLVSRTGAQVVYGAGPLQTLQQVAAVAADLGVWCQVALDPPTGCGTGLCLGCVVPVVGEDRVTRQVRRCHEGPVFRGDRVRWDLVAPAAVEPAATGQADQ